MNNDNFWKNLWEQNSTPWESDSSDQLLFKHFDQIKYNFKISKEAKIFIPLCGKSPAIKFFLDQAYQVTILDFVNKAIEDLLQSQFAGEKPDRLNILIQDIFKFNFENSFDLIYDRAALVALRPDQRQVYLKILKKALKPQGLIIMEIIDFEQESGPPYPIKPAELKKLENSLLYELIDSTTQPHSKNTEKFFQKNLMLISKL